jgi:hypothetical protein
VGKGIYDVDLRLKLAGTRTEVLPVGQRLQDRARGVDAREGDAITAPADFDALSLQGEEDDQCGNRDGRAKGSGGDAESLSAQNSQSEVRKVTH